MGYLVAHFRKIKTCAGLGAVANHNSRWTVFDETGGLRGDPPDWLVHLDRADQNEGEQDKRDESILRARNRVIENANLARKPQKNAAAAVELVLSASPDAIKASDWKGFFKDCREWVDQKFTHENVLQWNTHFDEKTPHMHVLLVPIIRNIDEKSRYSSAAFLGGREGLRQIQTELADQVGKKWGLERGLEGSQARHTDQAQWIAKERAAIKADKKELEEDRAALKVRELEAGKVAADIEAAKKEAGKEQAALKKEAAAVAKERAAIEADKKTALAAYNERVVALNETVDSLNFARKNSTAGELFLESLKNAINKIGGVFSDKEILAVIHENKEEIAKKIAAQVYKNRTQQWTQQPQQQAENDRPYRGR